MASSLSTFKTQKEDFFSSCLHIGWGCETVSTQCLLLIEGAGSMRLESNVQSQINHMCNVKYITAKSIHTDRERFSAAAEAYTCTQQFWPIKFNSRPYSSLSRLHTLSLSSHFSVGFVPLCLPIIFPSPKHPCIAISIAIYIHTCMCALPILCVHEMRLGWWCEARERERGTKLSVVTYQRLL